MPKPAKAAPSVTEQHFYALRCIKTGDGSFIPGTYLGKNAHNQPFSNAMLVRRRNTAVGYGTFVGQGNYEVVHVVVHEPQRVDN